jgi:rhodanese-related sulfurtransferase
MVVLGIGVKPEVRLAQDAGLAIGSTGGILVNDYLQTSNPSIYAAGDAIQVKDIITQDNTLLPMAGPANRQGWIVANNIAGRTISYSGVQGTAIVKVMNIVAASTGKNEKTLRQIGQEFQVCHIIPSSHASYYPGATDITIKLLFAPASGKIFGAQIVGSEGVDKRIDVLATAIRAGMTVFDLQELELAYAPPFSSAKDPINMVGYAAANIVNHDVEVIQWDEALTKMDEGAFLLDLRTIKELKEGTVEGSTNIPLDEIREHLAEIPQNREILVYCRSGLRSYVGCRILCQLGYHVKNIDGGYLLYQNIKD